MNILQMEDMVKGLPDQILMQEAQMPSGQIPQFLALSEVQRRQEMRQKLQASPEATVADQILQGGIASALPQQGPQQPPAPPQGMPQGMPPQRMSPQMGPPQAPMMAYGGGRMPYAMAGGGMVPGGIVKMQNLGQVPDMTLRMKAQNLFSSKPKIPSDMDLKSFVKTMLPTFDQLPPDAQAEVLARFEPQYVEARQNTEMFNRASVEDPNLFLQEAQGLNNNLVASPSASTVPTVATPPAATQAAPAAPAAAPSGVAPDATATGTLPTEDAVLSAENISKIFSNVLGGMGTSSSLPTNIEARTKELRDFLGFDPNDPALKPTDLSPLMKQERERATKRAESYEQTIKNIENEMKRERLGAVLTTLGANLMAGEGALGLEKAGKLAQEMGKEARQEIAAERRAARSAEEASTDRLFALNAQQLSANKESQREIFKMQQGLNESVLNALIKAGESDRASKVASAQVAATLTSSIVNSVRDFRNNTGADRRTALDYAKGVVKEQLATLSTKPEFLKLNQEQVDQLMKDIERKALQTAADFLGIEIPEGFGTTTAPTTTDQSDPFGIRQPR